MSVDYEQFMNHIDFKDEIIDRQGKALSHQLEAIFIEALKMKGIVLENKIELEKFVSKHCRCEDNIHKSQRVYYVDDVPFFLHNYEAKIDYGTRDSMRITASLGTYSYL